MAQRASTALMDSFIEFLKSGVGLRARRSMAWRKCSDVVEYELEVCDTARSIADFSCSDEIGASLPATNLYADSSSARTSLKSSMAFFVDVQIGRFATNSTKS